MEIEIRSFAGFREALGQKTVTTTAPEEATVGDVLRELDEEHPELEVFDTDGSPREYITVMKNGKDITHMEGMETRLDDGDTISAFPPVAGG
ncbi:ubiquitin-like small modifier protein 1 [Natronoarchaeum sp. GCM10025703]|uniref:ubiquitin-like small modifier protein 1 n=1 Tax=unclassified Natronoarchaeum TaxID=2620183 RepID=UPI0036112ED9